MKNDICKNVQRRMFIFGSFCVGASIGILSKFFDLQFFQYDQYQKLANQNRTSTHLDKGARGNILDCNLIPIAISQKFYNIICRPAEVLNPQALSLLLSEALDLTTEEKTNFFTKITQKKHFIITSTSDWQKVSKLEFKSDQLPGMHINQEYKRFYPLKNAASHIIGHEKGFGLEHFYDNTLSPGSQTITKYVDVKGNVLKEMPPKINKKAKNTVVSLCSRSQKFIYEQLKNHIGSACVMEISTGKVKAVVNFPSYDNNIFSYPIKEEKWRELVNNTNKPLLNRALSSGFQPGSTFKVVSALAILEGGLADEKTTVECRGDFKVGNRLFRCWKKSGHGRVNIKQAIAQSCNVYFYKTGFDVNIEHLSNIARDLGLGHQRFTSLKEERYGILPDRIWTEKSKKGQWYKGDHLNTVIGHGYIAVTPFQLMVMISRIASGKEIFPTFDNNACTDHSFKVIAIDKKNLQIVQDAILGSFGSQNGVLHRSTSKIQKIAGKTGTAQIFNTENQNTKNKTHNALFVGYNRPENPQYAISVVLENAGSGANAAKVGVKILDCLHSLDL